MGAAMIFEPQHWTLWGRIQYAMGVWLVVIAGARDAMETGQWRRR